MDKYFVDTETGEIIDGISAYLQDLYEKTPVFIKDNLLATERDVSRLLFYVANADDRMSAKEKAIIAPTCRLITNDLMLSDEIVFTILAKMTLFSLEAFRYSVLNLKSIPKGYRKCVVDAAEKMMQTDKTVKEKETYTLGYLKNTLLTEN